MTMQIEQVRMIEDHKCPQVLIRILLFFGIEVSALYYDFLRLVCRYVWINGPAELASVTKMNYILLGYAWNLYFKLH